MRYLVYVFDECEYSHWVGPDLCTFVPFHDHLISTSYGAHQLCVF